MGENQDFYSTSLQRTIQDNLWKTNLTEIEIEGHFNLDGVHSEWWRDLVRRNCITTLGLSQMNIDSSVTSMNLMPLFASGRLNHLRLLSVRFGEASLKCIGSGMRFSGSLVVEYVEDADSCEATLFPNILCGIAKSSQALTSISMTLSNLTISSDTSSSLKRYHCFTRMLHSPPKMHSIVFHEVKIPKKIFFLFAKVVATLYTLRHLGFSVSSELEVFVLFESLSENYNGRRKIHRDLSIHNLLSELQRKQTFIPSFDIESRAEIVFRFFNNKREELRIITFPFLKRYSLCTQANRIAVGEEELVQKL